MPKQTFTEYLESYYEQNINSNSNNMNPEFEGARDSWLSNLDVQELIDFADSWGHDMYMRGQTDIKSN